MRSNSTLPPSLDLQQQNALKFSMAPLPPLFHHKPTTNTVAPLPPFFFLSSHRALSSSSRTVPLRRKPQATTVSSFSHPRDLLYSMPCSDTATTEQALSRQLRSQPELSVPWSILLQTLFVSPTSVVVDSSAVINPCYQSSTARTGL